MPYYPDKSDKEAVYLNHKRGLVSRLKYLLVFKDVGIRRKPPTDGVSFITVISLLMLSIRRYLFNHITFGESFEKRRGIPSGGPVIVQ